MLHARKDYNERIQDSAGIIPDGEPVFLLRARDKFMPLVLDYYATLVSQESGHDVNIVKNTLAHKRTVRFWQEDKGCKSPDMEAKDSVY